MDLTNYIATDQQKHNPPIDSSKEFTSTEDGIFLRGSSPSTSLYELATLTGLLTRQLPSNEIS